MVIILVLILLGLCMIYIRQNNTCLFFVKKRENLTIQFEKENTTLLRSLNNWAKNDEPATPLNNWCVSKDNSDNDLDEGQYCYANCAGIGNQQTDWFPGNKIKKTGSRFEYETTKDVWVDFDLQNKYTKSGYCYKTSEQRAGTSGITEFSGGWSDTGAIEG
jgi:hypothetical protein